MNDDVDVSRLELVENLLGAFLDGRVVAVALLAAAVQPIHQVNGFVLDTILDVGPRRVDEVRHHRGEAGILHASMGNILAGDVDACSTAAVDVHDICIFHVLLLLGVNLELLVVSQSNGHLVLVLHNNCIVSFFMHGHVVPYSL